MTDKKLSGEGQFKPGAKDWKDNKYGLEDGYRAVESQEDTAPLLGMGAAMILLPIALILAVAAVAYMLWDWFH